MAFIVFHGTVANPEPAWPVGATMTCHNCGCVWNIEAGDDARTNVERRPHGRRMVYMDCPECQAPNQKDDRRTLTMATYVPFESCYK